jgi:hypothetical protein
MRPIKLAVAIVGAAASLTLPGAAASAAFRYAHPHLGRHAHGCRLTLALKEPVITKGEAAVASGALECAGQGELAPQAVTLFEHVAGSPGYTVAATGTTEAKTGAYSIEVNGLEHNAQLYASADGLSSGRRTEKVFAEVKLEGPPEGVQPTTLRTGRDNEITFKGTVSPADPFTIAVLQRQNVTHGEQWHAIGRAPVVAGSFVIKHVFRVPGPANIRVVVHALPPGRPSLNAASPSNILTYEIAQAQNPDLLINSSADPLSYGQSMTISGTVQSAAAHTPVRLFARAAHHTGFTPIAETETKEGGGYAFEKLTPLVGTLYRAEAAGKASAVLFEGVKYLLTAQVEPSASTLSQGEKVRFFGTVKPGMGIEGHPVYLERESVTHIGFHVIALGQVLPPSGGEPEYHYEIPYYLFKTGTNVLRVRIPGDPQNGGASSEKFTIQVNPAPAAKLLSEPPNNPKLPSEGQL